MGEWVEPSEQRLDAYSAQWIQGQRLGPATLASYRENIRLHIDPYLGAQPVARVTGPAVDAWMRHTHATMLLADGVPVKVVSERLGHASVTITLTVHQNVHPSMGREAADRFAALLGS